MTTEQAIEVVKAAVKEHDEAVRIYTADKTKPNVERCQRTYEAKRKAIDELVRIADEESKVW